MEVIMNQETQHRPDYVSRNKAERYFDGLNAKTLANLNSKGQGPKPYKRERIVFYRYADLVRFVEGK